MRSLCVAKRSPLDDLLDDRVGGPYDVSLAHDSYNGPLSAKARALVEYVGERKSSSFISLSSIVVAENGTQPET
jgi:hypothetical protein